MKMTTKWTTLLFSSVFLLALQFVNTPAQAQSSYFTSRGCVDCHSAPTVATCAGCHQHSGTLTATKNKTTSYSPGETVTITLTASGARSGWIGARLYDQSGAEIARSSGGQSGMGGATLYPAVLSAPAPATAGTYAWRIAYFGNTNGTGAGDVHSEKSVNVSIAVAAAADTTAPVVSAFTLPATATSLTIPVSGFTATDNVGVTGYQITSSATAPTTWSAVKPTSVTASAAGSATFYAWAKDAAGNVSLAKSAAVTVTIASSVDIIKPQLTISTLANGAFTNSVTLNISGRASDAGGLQSVIANGQNVTIAADGSFSIALTLQIGDNNISVVATDKAGNQTVINRIIKYDPNAPILAVTAPTDNSTATNSLVTVSGTVSEVSTVTVAINNTAPQYATLSNNAFSSAVYLTAGINTISISAVDPAGNISNAKRTVTFYSNKPTLAVTSPNQDITTDDDNLTLRGTVTDTQGKVTIRIVMDGKTYNPRVVRGAFAQRLSFRAIKPYAITVTARDAAGNITTVVRNVIHVNEQDDDDDDGGTTSHPFGWTNPRSSHQDYADDNGVAGCVSCHSIASGSKGQTMSCYNCHGKEWDTPATGDDNDNDNDNDNDDDGNSDVGTTSHPFGWTNPESSHQDYAADNGVAGCVSCHSIASDSQGQMSCYNCHGKEWDTPSTGGGSTGGTTTTSHPFGWTNPRSSHQDYASDNGVNGCVSCHSTASGSKGQAMSCYNCHGKEW